MNSPELKKILADHKMWFESNKKDGRRAVLRGLDLRGVDMRGLDLRFVVFRDSDMRGVDFRGADLRDTDLSDTDLRGANFKGANLCGALFQNTKGFFLLPVQDPRGYSFAHASQTEGGWRIRVACRDLSVEEALEHWGDAYTGDRTIGDMYLNAVRWLKAQLRQDADHEPG